MSIGTNAAAAAAAAFICIVCLFITLCGVFAVIPEANYVSRVYNVDSDFVVLIYGACSVMCHDKSFVLLTFVIFEGGVEEIAQRGAK